MQPARMRSPRNTEEEEVFVDKAGAPKDHVMIQPVRAAELIKGALFFVVFFALFFTDFFAFGAAAFFAARLPLASTQLTLRSTRPCERAWLVLVARAAQPAAAPIVRGEVALCLLQAHNTQRRGHSHH